MSGGRRAKAKARNKSKRKKLKLQFRSDAAYMAAIALMDSVNDMETGLGSAQLILDQIEPLALTRGNIIVSSTLIALSALESQMPREQASKVLQALIEIIGDVNRIADQIEPAISDLFCDGPAPPMDPLSN